jgi:DNA-nicking Smr family endonuclease
VSGARKPAARGAAVRGEPVAARRPAGAAPPTTWRVTSLSDLGTLRDRAAADQRDRARVAARLAARRTRAAGETLEFRAAVGPVHPLKAAGRVHHEPERPAPEPRQRQLDERQALREAWSDELDTDRLLETDEALSFRRPGIGPDVVKRLRRGVWSIQAACDLHGLRRDDAREALAGFLREALRQGLRCVRVVHGKGNGSPGRAPVLRGKVRAWLVQKDEVIAFTQARAADGGTGALLVLLRPSGGAPRG